MSARALRVLGWIVGIPACAAIFVGLPYLFVRESEPLFGIVLAVGLGGFAGNHFATERAEEQMQRMEDAFERRLARAVQSAVQSNRQAKG